MFSLNFPSNAVIIMSGDIFLTRVMTIFIKTYIFVKVREAGEGKEGKGREGGRKDMVANNGRTFYVLGSRLAT